MGKALVERVIDETGNKNAPSLYLPTFANIPWNAPFYEKCDFLENSINEQPEIIKTILREERNHGLDNGSAMRYNGGGIGDRLHPIEIEGNGI